MSADVVSRRLAFDSILTSIVQSRWVSQDQRLHDLGRTTTVHGRNVQGCPIVRSMNLTCHGVHLYQGQQKLFGCLEPEGCMERCVTKFVELVGLVKVTRCILPSLCFDIYQKLTIAQIGEVFGRKWHVEATRAESGNVGYDL